MTDTGVSIPDDVLVRIHAFANGNEDIEQEAILRYLENPSMDIETLLRRSRTDTYKALGEFGSISLDVPFSDDNSTTRGDLLVAPDDAIGEAEVDYEGNRRTFRAQSSIALDGDVKKLLSQKYPYLSIKDALRRSLGLPTLRASDRWNPEEDAILRKYYPNGGYHSCKPFLDGRGKEAIYQRVRKLGLKTDSFGPQVDGWVPLRQAATILGTSHKKVWDWCKAGEIPHRWGFQGARRLIMINKATLNGFVHTPQPRSKTVRRRPMKVIEAGSKRHFVHRIEDNPDAKYDELAPKKWVYIWCKRDSRPVPLLYGNGRTTGFSHKMADCKVCLKAYRRGDLQ